MVIPALRVIKHPGSFLRAKNDLAIRIENFFGRLDESGGLNRWFFPPYWHAAKPFVSDGIFRLIKYWIIVCPLIVAIVSSFPVEVTFPEGFKVVVGGNFVVPFSFKLSFVSALLLMASLACYKVRCPSFIQKHEARFSAFPDTLTNTDFLAEYREFSLGGLPRTITIEGKVPLRRVHGGAYFTENLLIKGRDNQAFHARAANSLTEEDLRALCLLLEASSSHAQFERISRAHFILPSLSGHAEKSKRGYFLADDGGGVAAFFQDQKYKDVENSLKLLLWPDLSVQKDFRNTAFTALYFSEAKSRSVSRLVFWLMYTAGAVTGLIVLVQLITRGISVMLFS